MKIQVIDSHTAGEPTRVVIAGGPDLGRGSMKERLERFRDQHDAYRSAIVNEPRGSDVLVGALLCEPEHEDSAAGVIFFNNVGYLGMCGHGTIGLMATLAHMERVKPGKHRIETPVGIVEASLHGLGVTSVVNVPSYRKARDIAVQVPGIGEVRGDVAWGGNWFFLTKDVKVPLRLESTGELTTIAYAIRDAVHAAGFPEVDHVELFGPAQSGGDSRNFVLCTGGAYDRSPCGTGTSAKLACLAADGHLLPGDSWTQESILGSMLRGSFRWVDQAKGIIAPTITGSASIIAEATLLLDSADPFCWGIR